MPRPTTASVEGELVERLAAPAVEVRVSCLRFSGSFAFSHAQSLSRLRIGIRRGVGVPSPLPTLNLSGGSGLGLKRGSGLGVQPCDSFTPSVATKFIKMNVTSSPEKSPSRATMNEAIYAFMYLPIGSFSRMDCISPSSTFM